MQCWFLKKKILWNIVWLLTAPEENAANVWDLLRLCCNSVQLYCFGQLLFEFLPWQVCYQSCYLILLLFPKQHHQEATCYQIIFCLSYLPDELTTFITAIMLPFCWFIYFTVLSFFNFFLQCQLVHRENY